MRHKAHVIPVYLPGYKCCQGHVHGVDNEPLKETDHLPCIHGLSAITEHREEPCDCDEEE